MTFIEFEVQKVQYNDKISHAGEPVEAKFTLRQTSTIPSTFSSEQSLPTQWEEWCCQSQTQYMYTCTHI